jgi:hypothetical protein
MKRFALAILALSLVATPVLAQPGKPEQPPPQEERVAPPAAGKKVKTLNIEAIDVKGARVMGDHGPISVSQGAKFTSLIRIRYEYIDLIVKTAEEL